MATGKPKQLNATIDEDVIADFNAFCKTKGYIRDQKVQYALELVLNTEQREPPRCVVISLDTAAARMLQQLRSEEFLADAVATALGEKTQRKPPRKQAATQRRKRMPR